MFQAMTKKTHQTETKIQPVRAWELTESDITVRKNALGPYELDSDGPPIPFYQRVKFYYYFFLCFGLDISGNTSKSKSVLLSIVRYCTLAMFALSFLWNWCQIFFSLKDEYLEYGATLINLVITAHITSGLITHTIMHNRIDKLVALINKLDNTNCELKFTSPEIKKVTISIIFGLLFALIYYLVPIKWTPGKFYENPNWEVQFGSSVSYRFQKVIMLVLHNYVTTIVVVIVCLFDTVCLSFFILFSQRFYSVFRRSPFVKLLEKSNQNDICLIMQEFRKHHFTISNFVEDVDEVFSPLILIWYVYLTLAMCCWIRAFSTDSFMRFEGALIVMVALADAFVQFFLLSSATGIFNDEVITEYL